MKNNKKTVVIIAGAAGEIGTVYAKHLTSLMHDVIGVIRNKEVEGITSPYFKQVQCKLDNPQSIETAFHNVNIESYDNVILLHAIGVDKFNPRNYPKITKMETIDPSVYDTNVNSFKYILRYIAGRVAKANTIGGSIKMKTAIIAGVSDKYTPFVIEDFCEAKLILRGYLRSYIDIYPEWFAGLSINVTSTVTQSALKVRPNADTKDWLTPEEVVKNSVKELLTQYQEYKEIDIIKFSKKFIEGYYENHKLLYEKWSTETGIFSTALTS